MFAPQNFALSIVFNFSWDNCNTQEKLKPEFIQIFFFLGGGGGGQTRCTNMGNAQETENSTVHCTSPGQLFVTCLIGFKCTYWPGGVVTYMLVGMCVTEKMSSQLHEKLLI